MPNRSRIVLGSLAGAFAIHIAALACSSTGDNRPSIDASTVDAGRTDDHDGSLVDVIAAAVDRSIIDASLSDAGAPVDQGGGMLDTIAMAMDVAGDVARDVAVAIVDSEVRDAHAGGDLVRTMEAPCNVPGGGIYSSFRYATFSVPGLNPRTAGEFHARVCGYTCTTDGGTCPSSYMPGGTDCQDTVVTSGTGSITVFCGAEGWTGTTARIWLH